jgi:hypothetical protein
MNQQQKAIGIGIGAFVTTALVARSRVLQAAIVLGGAGALAYKVRGRERQWHDVPPPPPSA